MKLRQPTRGGTRGVQITVPAASLSTAVSSVMFGVIESEDIA